MTIFANRAKVTTATTGTEAITLGLAVSGYASFQEAGIGDGDQVSYTIEDGTSFEVGHGTYDADTLTLTRTVLLSKVGGEAASTSPLSLSGSAVVFLTALAEDLSEFAILDEAVSFDKVGIGGATADATNRLSVNSPAVLFNRETDDIQVKVNKAATSNTASYLFQKDFSTRAEVGLVGDDDFVFKVSPDGNSFIEGIRIDKDTGRVSLPQTPAFGVTVDAVGDGVADDTAAILDAISAAVAAGGGTVSFPAGTFLVSNPNAPHANWDNDIALHIVDDNIHLQGAGRGATIIKLADGADCHVIKLGTRTTTPVTDCSVSHLTIDGNRANQSAPTSTDDHWNGIDVADDAVRIELKNLHIHDTQHYGIGFQRKGFIDCVVDDVVIERTGADGIDVKNDAVDNFGNKFTNITVREFGLAGGLSTDQAGLDIYGGVHLNGITVTDFGPTQGKNGIRFQSFDGLFGQSSPPDLVNFYCEGDGSADTIGVRVSDHNGLIANGRVLACETGVQLNQRENSVVNVTAENGGDGFEINDFGATTATPGDQNMFANCFARGGTGSGFLVAANEDRNLFVGCGARSNAVGVTIGAGAALNQFVGCDFNTNTTPVADSGSSTMGLGVHDFRSKDAAFADNFIRAATGTTGNAPKVSAQGGDTNINLGLAAKGTGTVVSDDGLVSNDATKGIGYTTGAGGAVTQATSRTTGVTLNTIAGAITLVSAAGGSGTAFSFTVTNSAVAATDVVIVNQKSGTDLYDIMVTAVGTGSFRITARTTGGNTSEQPVFNFAIIKAVAS